MGPRAADAETGEASRLYLDLCRNFSFVLHERSDSRPVHNAARAALRHARSLTNLPRDILERVTVVGVTDGEPDIVLTATIGVPQLLPAALAALGSGGVAHHWRFVVADQPVPPDALRLRFFRAPARLKLPERDGLVAVAVLVLRPGGHAAQLHVGAPRSWDEEADELIHDLERLVQAYVGQWMPARALWDAPAEVLLGNEISQTRTRDVEGPRRR